MVQNDVAAELLEAVAPAWAGIITTGPLDLVDRLVLRGEYDEVMREYYALVAKASWLRSRKEPGALEANERYTEALARLEAVEQEADAVVRTAAETGRYEELFQGLEGNNNGGWGGFPTPTSGD